MGQKVNPHGLRVGVIADWNTTWYADKKEFSKFLKEDNVIRTFLKKKYYAAAVSKILIERWYPKISTVPSELLLENTVRSTVQIQITKNV